MSMSHNKFSKNIFTMKIPFPHQKFHQKESHPPLDKYMKLLKLKIFLQDTKENPVFYCIHSIRSQNEKHKNKTHIRHYTTHSIGLDLSKCYGLLRKNCNWNFF